VDKYFRTLEAVKISAIKPEMSKPQQIRAYKTALIRHHGIRDEAKYIINTWIGESKNG
jgi:hypothetical protein|tara:strand:- start:68 stop:241 length:174 start_codon:yes stop_codon:yes gene_type:complete